MSDSVVEVGFKANSSALVAAAKAGDKALEGMGDEVANAGKKTKVLGKETQEAARDLDGMSRGARTAGEDVDGFARKAEQASKAASHLGRASQSLRTGGKVLSWGSEKFVNQYTALAGGAGIGLALKKQMDLNDEMTQMGIAARDAQGMINGQNFASWFTESKAKIMEVSRSTGQGAEELAGGMRAVIQRTGDMKLATEQLELMGVAATASGSSVEEMGGLIANLGQNVGIKGPEQMKQALTLLVAQGKTGAFEIKDMLSQGERMFTAMPNFRVQGLDGLKSFGAFVQMSRTANGNAETAAESIVSLGTAIAKLDDKKLAKAGIRNLKLTNKDGSKRSTEEIVKEIIKRTKGDMDGLIKANVFDEPAQRLIQKMANQYAEGKGFTAFDSFKNAGGDLRNNKMLDDDFAARVNDSKFQINRLMGALREFADKSLSAPLAALTRALSFFNGNAVLTDTLIHNITKGLLAMAAVAGSVKMYRMFQEFRGLFGGAKNAGRSSSMLGQVAGMEVQRVYVVNMGSVGLSGNGAQGLSGAGSVPEMYGPARPMSSWNRWGRSAAIGGGITGVGAAMAFAENGNTPEGWGRALGGAAGVALGAFGGPIGMLIGQQIGDTVGLFVGNAIGQSLKDAESNRRQKKYEEDADLGDKKMRAVNQRFLHASDVTSNGSNMQRVAESAMKTGVGMGYQSASATDIKQAGITAKDLEKLNIVLNVETHVAKDGSTNTKVSQDKPTGFFKTASDSLGSLTAPWALGH